MWPLAIELADDLSCLVRVKAFLQGAIRKAVLFEVALESFFEGLVLLWVLEERVKDGLEDLRGQVTVLQADFVLLDLDPRLDSLNWNSLYVEAGEVEFFSETMPALANSFE